MSRKRKIPQISSIKAGLLLQEVADLHNIGQDVYPMEVNLDATSEAPETTSPVVYYRLSDLMFKPYYKINVDSFKTLIRVRDDLLLGNTSQKLKYIKENQRTRYFQ